MRRLERDRDVGRDFLTVGARHAGDHSSAVPVGRHRPHGGLLQIKRTPSEVKCEQIPGGVLVRRSHPERHDSCYALRSYAECH